jgi:hypothetical protein
VVPFISWAHEQLASAQYGTTPTDHLNAVVGHQDSSMHPTHFIATNMNGQIAVSELPRGSAQHVTVYVIFQQLAASPGWSHANQAVVTLEIRDMNGDGKPDLVVRVTSRDVNWLLQPETIEVVLLNAGSTFKVS